MARGSSARLIGRGAELARLREALRAVRETDRPVVLVSGEAGIGKSRLLAEFERSAIDDPLAGRSTAVLKAGCVDVGESLAYLPIIELLDSARRFGGEIGREATALRHVLGGAGGADANDVATPTTGRAAGFLRIRELLVAAAGEGDLVVVIDDVNWADRSTLDVISFLARRLVGTGVLLVIAYRSDELNRRHPLRPVLADLERHAALDHIRLEPLSGAEVKAQATGILGVEPDQSTLERVLRLADGNPFYVEQLLSLADDRGLPPSVRDVLDARLDQLDDGSRRVVEVAAVIGRQVDAVLLASVAEAERDEMGSGLRQAVEARILEPTEDGRQYRFRHALLREAVYADVPPVDRIEAHRRIAQALTDDSARDVSPAVATAERARHWLAARAEPEAFAALLEAARSAATATAWAEARGAYESALGLWERIPDPVAVAGSRRSDILEQAAEIAWKEGDSRRALVLNRGAQQEADVMADPLRLGRLAYREAWLLDDLGDLAGEGEAAQRAYRLVPADPQSRDRAAAISRLGLFALREGRFHEAADLFEQAVDVAESIGELSEAATNITFLAMARVDLGEVARPRETVERLQAMLPEIGEQLVWSVVTTWTPWVWLGMADYERAIDDAARLLVDARERGLDRGVGLWSLAPRALAEFWLGRWDDASATVAGQGDYSWGLDAAIYLRSVAAQIAAGRGDLTRARSLAIEAVEIARPGFPEQTMIANVAAAWVELLDDRPEAAIGHVRDAWAVASRWEGLVIRSLVLWIGLWAAADLASRSPSRGTTNEHRQALDLGDELAGALNLAPSGKGGRGPAELSGPMLVIELAAAEASRIKGGDDARTWATIAERLERRGDLPRSFLARQRQAEAILRDRGDRADAATAVETAIRHAETMGAARLLDRAHALGQAARLKITALSQSIAPGAPPAEPWGLSKREREVLALLAGGRTNRQIGDALFISDKTASVHITHILDKLGVSRRTEAALLAVRAGLADDAVQVAPDQRLPGEVPPIP